MLLHTITGLHPHEVAARGLPLTFEFARFLKFIMDEIFPGGQLPSTPMVRERAAAGGFTVTRGSVTAEALCEDARHVGGGTGGSQG